MVEWGSTEEPYWNYLQTAKSLPLSKASSSKWCVRSVLKKGDLGNQGPFARKPKCLLAIAFLRRTWLSLSKPVKISSRLDLTETSSSLPIQNDVARHESNRTENQNYMWWKSTVEHITEAAFPGSPLPQLILSGRLTMFKIWPLQTAHSIYLGNTPHNKQALQMRLTLKYNNLTTSWCQIQDIVCTDRTSLKRIN